MIVAVGTDLVSIPRMRAALARYRDRLCGRLYTPQERAEGEKRPLPEVHFASRFAAKEACSKALGTGMRQGVFWRDMSVVNLPSGKPTLQLTNGASERLAAITPDGFEKVIHLTITDDWPLAQAFVIIEAIPR